MSELTRKEVEVLLTKPAGIRSSIEADRACVAVLSNDAALRAKVEALEDWQATVTAALGREGGALFEDVPKHIKGMVSQLATLTAELEEYRSIAEQIGAGKAVSQLAMMTAERDELKRRLEGSEKAAYDVAKTIEHLKADRDRLLDERNVKHAALRGKGG